MARCYAALPWEYLEEMDTLEDSEFGRLARALIRYSMTGEPMALTGNERFFAKRVMAQEDRYQESYRKQSAQNARNGASGGRPRRNGGNQRKAEGSGGNQNKPKKSENNRSEADETEKTQTETDTEEGTDEDEDDARARRDQSPAVGYYLDRINPTASPLSLEQIAAFEKTLGADLCIRACNMALDARPNNLWSYIRQLLSDWERAGIRTVAELEARERDWERRRQNGNAGRNSQSGGRRASVQGEAYPGGNPPEDTFQGRRLSKTIPV